MIPIWISLLISAVSGLVAAIVAPWVTQWLQHKYWQRQKQREWKYQVFCKAVDALAALVTDALDLALQANKATYKTKGGSELTREVELRPQTAQLMEEARGLVRAFFSTETAEAYEKALNSKVSIEDIPCLEFEENRLRAIKLMAAELGIT